MKYTVIDTYRGGINIFRPDAPLKLKSEAIHIANQWNKENRTNQFKAAFIRKGLPPKQIK